MTAIVIAFVPSANEVVVDIDTEGTDSGEAKGGDDLELIFANEMVRYSVPRGLEWEMKISEHTNENYNNQK